MALTRQQIIQGISILEKQGATQKEVQEWIDKNSGITQSNEPATSPFKNTTNMSKISPFNTKTETPAPQMSKASVVAPTEVPEENTIEEGHYNLKNIMTGAAKGMMSTLSNIADISTKVNPITWISDSIKKSKGIETTSFTEGLSKLTTGDKKSIDEFVKPENKGQQLGFFAEQMAEFLLPASKVAKVEKVADVAINATKLGTKTKTAAKLGSKMALEGTTFGGVSYAQTQDADEAITTGLATGLLMTPVAEGLGVAIPKVANWINNTLPEKVVKGALSKDVVSTIDKTTGKAIVNTKDTIAKDILGKAKTTSILKKASDYAQDAQKAIDKKVDVTNFIYKDLTNPNYTVNGTKANILRKDIVSKVLKSDTLKNSNFTATDVSKTIASISPLADKLLLMPNMSLKRATQVRNVLLEKLYQSGGDETTKQIGFAYTKSLTDAIIKKTKALSKGLEIDKSLLDIEKNYILKGALSKIKNSDSVITKTDIIGSIAGTMAASFGGGSLGGYGIARAFESLTDPLSRSIIYASGLKTASKLFSAPHYIATKANLDMWIKSYLSTKQTEKENTQ